MADNLDDEHGTSDEYNDPFCDLCFEGKGLNVKVYGYCKDCFQFLCSDCHIIHGQIGVSRRHVILQGASMPQSQADKPPKFEYCDAHQTEVKDKFCSAHRTLICSSCTFDHRKCVVKTVADVCKTVRSSETDLLSNAVKTLQDQAKSVLLSVQANVKKVGEQKKQLLQESQELFDKIIIKMKKLFQDIHSEIEAAYQSQATLLSQLQDRIGDIVSRLESSLNNIEQFKGKPVDTKLFLKIQGNVTDVNQLTAEFRNLNESLLFADLSLIPSKTTEEFLSTTFTLGSVLKSDIKSDTNIVVNEIQFPDSTHVGMLQLQQSRQQNLEAIGPDTRPSIPLTQIKAVKEGTYKVKVKKDKNDCDITGLAITKDGKRLMTDHLNHKVKMFSHDMKILSSVLIPERPFDITVISDKEAAVTTDKHMLIILAISGSHIDIKTEIQLSYDVRGICRCNDKLIVTSPGSKPPFVTLIDQTGRVYWSVSSDQQGQTLFSAPWYVGSHGDGRSVTVTVTVTDRGNDTLTTLNGDTGEIITRRQLKERKYPKGVTTDPTHNVYVCYRETREVSVLSGDLSQEKILLSGQDGLRDQPLAIAYDDKTHQLIISHMFHKSIDCFKLS